MCNGRSNNHRWHGRADIRLELTHDALQEIKTRFIHGSYGFIGVPSTYDLFSHFRINQDSQPWRTCETDPTISMKESLSKRKRRR